MPTAITALELGKVHAMQLVHANGFSLGTDVDTGKVVFVLSGGDLGDVAAFFGMTPEKARALSAELLKAADLTESAVYQPEKGNA